MTKKGEKYRTLALNTGLFALTAMATRFISFFLVPLYTYHMSAAEYGITDMSATVISLVTPLATLAIADAAVRYIVEDRGRDGDYAAIAFSITVLSILVVGAFTPVLDFDVFGGLGEYKVLFICTYASSAFLQLCSEVSRGMGRIKLIAVCAGISSLITFGLAVTLIGVIDLGIEGYFISVSAGPTAAVAIYLTAGNIGSTLVAGFRSIARGTDKARNAKITLGSMLRYSLPLIPNSLFWWIGTSINRFFLSGMLGIASSGMFAAGGKIPGLINTAYSVFQQAWQLSAFQESRKEGLERFFSMVFAYLQSLMIMLCSIISFAAPWLAIVMLQKDFYNAWPIIPILLLANLFNILNSFFGTNAHEAPHDNYGIRSFHLHRSHTAAYHSVWAVWSLRGFMHRECGGFRYEGCRLAQDHKDHRQLALFAGLHRAARAPVVALCIPAKILDGLLRSMPCNGLRNSGVSDMADGRSTDRDQSFP